MTYTINRTAAQIVTQSCTLNGDPTPCDDEADTSSKKPASSSYSVPLGPLANGDYTFTVTFNLGDGGSGSGTTQFTIDYTPPNVAPIANDDVTATDQNTPVILDVLANDADTDGDTLTVAAVGVPTNGTAGIDPGGTITYTPNLDFTGTDSFTYTVSDGVSTDVAIVTVTVVPVVLDCTYTAGYWKTHTTYGPGEREAAWDDAAGFNEDSTFFLSGQTYYEVMFIVDAGNLYYPLANQYIAAKLNIANGASSTTEVDAAINGAMTLFNTYTPDQVAGDLTIRSQFLALAATLDSYNNGLTGPGNCGGA